MNAIALPPRSQTGVESLGANFVELDLETEGPGDDEGYAVEMGEGFYEQQRKERTQVVAESDVVIVSGANDLVNPLANEDDSGPIAGMPILNVSDTRQVIVNKCSLSLGFSGIPNPLSAKDNTSMLFDDAKELLQDLFNEYKEGRYNTLLLSRRDVVLNR